MRNESERLIHVGERLLAPVSGNHFAVQAFQHKANLAVLQVNKSISYQAWWCVAKEPVLIALKTGVIDSCLALWERRGVTSSTM